MLGSTVRGSYAQAATDGAGLATLRRVRSTDDVPEVIEAMVTLLRQRHYSVGDLLRDIASLKAEEGYETACLDAVLAECVDRTSRVHELAIETMQHGFCELGPDGRIRYANPALQALLPGCEGTRLAEHFERDAALVEAAVSNGRGGHTHQVEMTGPDRTRPVMVTIGPGEGPASFAFIIDMTAAASVERRAHDTAPFAILQLDPDHRITYANPEAGKLLGGGAENLVGTIVGDRAADAAARAVLEQEFAKRRLNKTSEYRLEMQPFGGTSPEPMLVRSLPRTDPDGRLASTLVMLQRIGPEEVAAEIRNVVASATEAGDLFNQIVETLRPLLAFDMAVLWVYTAGREYSRLLYAQPSLEVDALWFEVPPAFRAMPDRPEPFGMIKNTLETTKGGETLSQEAVVLALQAKGMQSWFSLPIGDPTDDAVLVFYNRRPDYFSLETEVDLTKAGVAQAMQAVLRLRAEREVSFRFDLMRKMAAQRTDRELAALVVNELAAFYRWENVSILKVNPAQRLIELLAQASGPDDGYCLPEDHRQPIGAGFLGAAVSEERIVVVNDAKSEPESKLFVVGSDKTRSELIVPVRADGQIVWVLNIEDARKNAFRQPDVDAISELMDKIGDGLGRLLVAAVLAQVLEEVPHAVVITDLSGKILVYNHCAQDMIGPGVEGLSLPDLFAGSPDAAEAVLCETSLPVKGVLISADRTKTEVFVSARMPRVQYDRRVVLIQDARQLAQQSEAREVMRALADVASQTRIPLSLASSYIRQIGRQTKGILGGVAEMAASAAAQLATVELTYSRVVDQAKRQPQSEPVSLDEAMAELVAQLPEPLAQRVRLSRPATDVIETDRKPLINAIGAMLAYALRTADGDIEVRIRPFRRFVGLSMSQTLPSNPDLRDLAMARFALDAPGLVQFAGLCGGGFRHRRAPERDTLQLTLRRGEPRHV